MGTTGRRSMEVARSSGGRRRSPTIRLCSGAARGKSRTGSRRRCTRRPVGRDGYRLAESVRGDSQPQPAMELRGTGKGRHEPAVSRSDRRDVQCPQLSPTSYPASGVHAWVASTGGRVVRPLASTHTCFPRELGCRRKLRCRIPGVPISENGAVPTEVDKSFRSLSLYQIVPTEQPTQVVGDHVQHLFRLLDIGVVQGDRARVGSNVLVILIQLDFRPDQ